MTSSDPTLNHKVRPQKDLDSLGTLCPRFPPLEQGAIGSLARLSRRRRGSETRGGGGEERREQMRSPQAEGGPEKGPRQGEEGRGRVEHLA